MLTFSAALQLRNPPTNEIIVECWGGGFCVLACNIQVWVHCDIAASLFTYHRGKD